MVFWNFGKKTGKPRHVLWKRPVENLRHNRTARSLGTQEARVRRTCSSVRSSGGRWALCVDYRWSGHAWVTTHDWKTGSWTASCLIEIPENKDDRLELGRTSHEPRATATCEGALHTAHCTAWIIHVDSQCFLCRIRALRHDPLCWISWGSLTLP